MRETNLSGLDLNLLPALRALLLRRNVTLAAADVGLSQPAMSRVLARLRDVLQDPLLVRVSGGYALSARAQQLLPRVALALDGIKSVFEPLDFNPVTETRTFHIVAADVQTILLAPGLMARLRAEAPNINVHFESFGPNTIARMSSGEADLAFALASTPLPPGAMSEEIAEDSLALVMRRDHPAAQRPWTIADYGVYAQAAISLLGDGASDMDSQLAAAGIVRRVAFVSPLFMATLAALAHTDMVATISANFARRFAKTFDLVVREPPLPHPDLKMVLVWSQMRESDAALKWLRGVLREVAREVYVQP